MANEPLMLTNGLVVTMNESRDVIQNGFVTIRDDEIINLGTMEQCPAPGSAKVIEVNGKAVLPGFINAHSHSIDMLQRGGLIDDRAFFDWFLNIGYPALGQHTLEDYATSARLFYLEAIRSGITTVVDMVEFPFDQWESQAGSFMQVYSDAGVRVIYAQSFYDYDPVELHGMYEAVMAKEPDVIRPFPENIETKAALDKIEKLMDKYHGYLDGRISVWPSPGVAKMCSKDAFLGCKELARKRGVSVTSHISEAPVDRYLHGISAIEYLNNIGFLGPDVLAAHCVQVDDKDIRTLARSGAKVATNPVSNMYLGNGIAPVTDIMAAGITVGLGTDDGMANGNVNMFSDMKIFTLAQKGIYKDAAAVTAERVLEMATIEGAKAINMEHKIGSLETGKKADLFTLDLTPVNMIPRHSIASAIVYQALGNEVEMVFVDGNMILDKGKPCWLSENEETEFLKKAQDTSERVSSAANIPIRNDSTWLDHN